ncbi:hypothetical protein KUV85_00220 [Nocardioides panacisoli]|uniref:hypothetical protein n=1 Tax=Nocardioides panacisoli TaxID=627624 RepID=UPI001C630DA8|nr:hypothetical protein [Nocardioides panacisoli]QYJ04139.1 hypothetical protein KUV85_00220 [Nocardioides panacisoli]
MSIPVAIGDLAGALADFGSGYLLTTTEGRVKVVTVDPELDGTDLVARGPGRGTLANLAANPAVTVVFPPAEPKGYTLLVDGTAAAEGEDVRVTPTTAVLHRPRSHADGPVPPDGCGHDCAPV